MKRLCIAALLLPLAALAQAQGSLTPRVSIETSAGTFVLEVDAVRAPLTAENFLGYVRDGFYDGTVLHRVIPGFVVQGGGFDPAYQLKPTRASVVNESGNGLSNLRGTVGMARGDTPHSATAQFYVNLADNRGLDPLPSRWGYAVFGRVVEGMDVVDRISQMPTGTVSNFAEDVPVTPIVLRRASIVGTVEPPRPAASAGEPPAAETTPAEAASGDPPAEDPPAAEPAEAPAPPAEPGTEP
jgi:cyclophilin family peptidyl-prolyl cis-trans isomerase